jgi:hypothetical protein
MVLESHRVEVLNVQHLKRQGTLKSLIITSSKNI